MLDGFGPVAQSETELSLSRLLDPSVLADPYPLYSRLRSNDPVHWDIFLHSWVVTRYIDVVRVLRTFSASRCPSPERLEQMGLSELSPISAVMVRQMLFLDPPDHSRIRSIAAFAFTPARVEKLRDRIRSIASQLLACVIERGEMDVIADFAEPLPALVTAVMLGVPEEDHILLKQWSADFAEMLGNFQHNPDRIPSMLRSVDNLVDYFRSQLRDRSASSREGLIHSLMTAEVNGDRLSEEEVIANCIITLVGGQETTTNLIGNGLLMLFRNPLEFDRLRRDPSMIQTAVEEMLRFDCPSQHTARLAPCDTSLGDRRIKAGQAVIAVMAAANRDPERFPSTARVNLSREDNRHLAFGWASHFCFGAPLARLEGQIAFQLLAELPNLQINSETLSWRSNLGLRGLTALPVAFDRP